MAAWIAATLAACAPAPPPPTLADRYQRWQRTAAPAADAYLAYLRQHGVADTLPPEQLLRSARRWRRCHAEEFAVPPQRLWPAMVPTLRLVRELRAAGLLERPRVGSGYREPALNRCEGGADGSKHTANAALDFDLAPMDAAKRARLCDYWRRHGAARRFGLGFYDSGAIHVDTAGHRTWGYDHTRRSSLCNHVDTDVPRRRRQEPSPAP
ncbi:D-Ala-D-Ala carboxypeptidase family metallohydrolase [Lysobacter sp. 5GHs7-4]|uniref:D-Ala-D-Ala carboxypeptidase family metallohydrolase n=1 Tax=Lysobacter sp. 5GHs7-4 TaxID=2904253 RepID=UPI001E4EF3AF|nr:D-Ala-D-Ala carboxypeptidase family metallohydrolase [Lysobacter sp. 5GHs7-4]UHQ24573.1 D-Ala-D-Ala carboxypeptidase family metallohydrolase [Lysobacter sp. 5GHs7-4]